MKEAEIKDDLASIRSLMERSSKFLSLSGLSGILAGVYALIGAGVAYLLIEKYPEVLNTNGSFFDALNSAVNLLYAIGIVVLLLSIITAYILSAKKARKNGQTVWNNTSKSLLLNMAVPLFTGGIIVLILIYQGYINMVAPAMLVFYGLSLFNAGNFTFADIRYLGISEIILGIIASFMPNYGLLFWALGFGVLHVIYGSVMYLKYDR